MWQISIESFALDMCRWNLKVTKQKTVDMLVIGNMAVAFVLTVMVATRLKFFVLEIEEDSLKMEGGCQLIFLILFPSVVERSRLVGY